MTDLFRSKVVTRLDGTSFDAGVTAEDDDDDDAADIAAK